MSLATADLSDHFGTKARILQPLFRDFGGKRSFHGEAITIETFEDNSKVREVLETEGKGRVLVVDGAGSTACALLGDNLAALAVKNGWSGVLVNGCVRDTAQLAEMPLGVKALGPCPRKSEKRGIGKVGVQVEFAGVVIRPGDYVYADLDGILISETQL